MALVFIEGFDAYGTTVNVAPVGMGRKWSDGAVSSFMRVRTGRLTGYSVSLNPWDEVGFAVPATQTLILGFGFNSKTANLAETRVVEFRDGSTIGINLRRQTTGEWSIYLGTTHLATTSGEALTYDTWCYVELRVKVDNSAGEYELRVNGSVVLSASSTDTQPGSNAFTDTIRLVATNASGVLLYYDDLYLLDETGSTNNTFLGPVKVETIFPSADSAVDCTPSTGSDNYALLDDNAANDDTDYVTGAAADVDLYDYPSVDSNVIFGLVVNTVCRETDATPLDIVQLAKSGSTTGSSAAETIGSSTYVMRKAIFEENPDTSSAWTNSGVNAAQFGFEIQ